ncbi:hypothetical protein GCM10009007_19100 [Formosimonas limnophila]|uniref:DUF4254 domain-containing protein n=1 Tax=Formosimonas limnophila TaxID=1384487 RepID=A0A8J3CLU8_9BURK|nr:DUF4254 domain-containing protein [Formosimonas limnophila]GHA78264.1 hypothetical protein GCM10009007_19100 [Formosimonas limnophila]
MTHTEFFHDISSTQVIAFHDACLARADFIYVPRQFSEGVWAWIETNHFNNASLWAEEDLARRTTVSGDEIAKNKRAIDGFNQARNDATERVDEEILVRLVDVAHQADARLNSETAGSMIDRMSIMSLKIKAMRAQTQRTDVDAVHIASCEQKLATLIEQRNDLGGCLDALLTDAQAGRAYYKIYRQFKMYNDKTLNPELVKETK